MCFFFVKSRFICSGGYGVEKREFPKLSMLQNTVVMIYERCYLHLHINPSFSLLLGFVCLVVCAYKKVELEQFTSLVLMISRGGLLL